MTFYLLKYKALNHHKDFNELCFGLFNIIFSVIWSIAKSYHIENVQ